MVTARTRFLGSGHFLPLTTTLTETARSIAAPEGLITEVGAGTAYYLAHVLDAMPGRCGLAIDISKYAARRAAKAHPRIGSIVSDIRDRLPVADESCGLILDVFAPRQSKEFHRLLRSDGALLVVTPETDHLVELRQTLGLLGVDADKEARITHAFDGYFHLHARQSLCWTMELTRQNIIDVVSMGPSARHIDFDCLTQSVSGFNEWTSVTAAVTLRVFQKI